MTHTWLRNCKEYSVIEYSASNRISTLPLITPRHREFTEEGTEIFQESENGEEC